MDPLLIEQPIMAENEPASPPPANEPSSSDMQLPPEARDGATALAQPELGLPPRPIAQKPRWPHPSFGWALLWCLLFWIIFQMPSVIIAVLLIVGLAIFSPNAISSETMKNPADLFKSDVMNVALAVGQFVAEIIGIGFCWLVIRLVVGRDWMRQLAVRRPSVPHTLLALAIFPAFALLGNIAYGLLRTSGHVPSVSDPNPVNLVYFWAAVFNVLGLALLISWLLAGFGWTRRLAARPARPADFLVTAAVLPILTVCIVVIYEGLRRALPVSGLESVKLGGMEEMGEVIGKWPWPFAVLVIGVGPGIVEELWCRGYLGRGLVGSHGVVLGVLASSFCFGLIHGDPCQGIMAMVMGLWLHFVYLTTRSLLLPMLLHFLNNSVAVMESRFPILTFLDTKPAEIPVIVYVSAALLLAAGVYALCQSRVRLAPRMQDQPLIWRPAFEGVEYPPAESGMRVVHPLPSPAATVLTSVTFLLFMLACANWVRALRG
ncbi:MAG TPA: type II CAAX endopeptidase family protein [Gemmataceae bacterium]|nr:type II CAAX endopeptidase family protein [Gemmataceae bacterium]